MTSQTKKYHAFISHSSLDKDAAKRLALDLQGRGYSVWFDEWEILVGHNIVDEVFGAIKQSHFMVVILSEASVNSRWVDEELTAAKTREIEDEQVVILPARLESCEIPPALTAKRYADFTGSWDDGVEEIARAIDGHSGNRPSRSANRIATPRPTVPSFYELDQWRENLLPEIAAAGFVEGQPFKDVLIGPIDGFDVNIDRSQLVPTVDTCRARLANGGGFPFPFERSYTTDHIYLPSGLRYVDSKLFMFSGSETFHFWQINSQLKFIQRSPIVEDIAGNDNSGNSLDGTLIRSWTFADIMCPLLFARNFVINLNGLDRIGVKFVWEGLGNRVLKEVSQNRMGFFRQYRCGVPEWTFESEISAETDLATEGQRAANDLFWLFGWVPDAGIFDRDFESLANGHLLG